MVSTVPRMIVTEDQKVVGRLPSRNGNREERELNGIIENVNTEIDTPQAI